MDGGPVRAEGRLNTSLHGDVHLENEFLNKDFALRVSQCCHADKLANLAVGPGRSTGQSDCTSCRRDAGEHTELQYRLKAVTQSGVIQFTALAQAITDVS
jgi:hypothetical protein